MSAGYSGTPLAKKLGIKARHRVATVDEPPEFRELLPDLPEGVVFDGVLENEPDITIGFFTSAAELDRRLPELGRAAFLRRLVRSQGRLARGKPQVAANTIAAPS